MPVQDPTVAVVCPWEVGVTGPEWAALIMGLASLVAALAGLPRDAPRGFAFSVSAVLAALAIGVGAGAGTGAGTHDDAAGRSPSAPSGGPSGAGSGSRDTGSGGATDPTPDPTAGGGTAPVDYLSIPVGTDGAVTARVYFGQLDALMSALEGTVGFATEASFRQENRDRCVGTVVFYGVPGSTGEVYAQRLGDGWSAAENKPDNHVAGPQRTLHQQLVVPPRVKAGTRWDAAASLTQDGTTVAVTDSYQLLLAASDGGSQTWQLSGRAVTCHSW